MKKLSEMPKGAPEIEFIEVELKNVLIKKNRTTEDLTVKVAPFDRFRDEHVEFSYAYSDMLYRAPSPFKSMDDAAREYVKIFMEYTEADEANEDSVFSKVSKDLRACRTLFNQEANILAITDFFVNA